MEWNAGKVFVFVVIAVESPLAGALESKRRTSPVTEAVETGVRGTGWTWGLLAPVRMLQGGWGLS